MTTLLVATMIVLVIIGLLLVAELAAITMLFFRMARLTRQVRDHVDPVVAESTRILHKVNDVADTVKTDTRRVADSVADVSERLSTMTDHLTHRVDHTTETMTTVTRTAMQQLTSPPVLTAMALFAGLQVGSMTRRLAGWPSMLIMSLFAGGVLGLRVWRARQGARVVAVEGAPVEAPLVLHPQVSPEETEMHHAA